MRWLPKPDGASLGTMSLEPNSILYVFVAGPYMKEYAPHNARDAMEAGTKLIRAGLVPYVPHLTMLWDTAFPMSYDEWCSYHLSWIERCDLLLRLPGDSPGADKEVAYAKRFGIPCWGASVDSFLRWRDGQPFLIDAMEAPWL